MDVPQAVESSHAKRAASRVLGLSIHGTLITDAGLVHLKGLTKLQELHLNETKVTDAGLAHLKRLAELQTLLLGGTSITDRGIAELQQALPNCFITK